MKIGLTKQPFGLRKKEIPADVRIVAATNENLEKVAEEGRFREDLYHRLNEFLLVIPPLQECGEDILPLAGFFLEQSCKEMNKKGIIGFDMEPQKIIQSYSWPGNVCDLKNCIRKAVLLTERNVKFTQISAFKNFFGNFP